MNRFCSSLVALLILGSVVGGCGMQAKQEGTPQEVLPKEAGLATSVGAPDARSAKTTAKPEQTIEVEALPAVQEENAVFFMLGSAFLNRNEKSKLEAIALRLSEDRALHVLLVGHANDNGSRAYNLAVSDSRVAAVAEYLRKHGIQRERIRTQALGSEKVPASCRSSLCRQKSRRVDVVTSSGR